MKMESMIDDISDNEEKGLDYILNEINLVSYFKNDIKQQFNEIMKIYNNRYKKMKKEEIKGEINSIKNNININITNIIASMIRVVEIEFNFKIRNTQIISLLICLLDSNKNGLIEEVKTGEGTTMIIA